MSVMRLMVAVAGSVRKPVAFSSDMI